MDRGKEHKGFNNDCHEQHKQRPDGQAVFPHGHVSQQEDALRTDVGAAVQYGQRLIRPEAAVDAHNGAFNELRQGVEE